ncbi:glutaminase A [Zhihengliuella salsuginis]|uniref:Glutaminase n=1 Tax=Zhihengliuella salsuginis TaxID=578222 RepID=A0ABQ3GJ65_9MICC|nr:glutaminase A [Zhihengliuella salsuginis]GHD06509.1 glutaminase 2 [Zhihengliuella salsuginis]
MRSPIEEYLRTLHRELSGLDDGVPFQNIPAMAAADPDDFAICLATVDGHVYEIGDSRTEFTIQSISKPFTYGLALEDHGLDAVDRKIDVEPSGDAFNEISLARDTGRPANPMINAGAIAATSLIKGSGGRDGFARILDIHSRFAGRSLSVSERVFASEAATGFRNRALADLLRSFDIIEDDPAGPVENYFRQCSIQVDARDLALMGATLANGGRQPVTGEQVVDMETVQRMLSVMLTCGMYDDAGAWTSAVGLPAKSGVGGGLMAVLPGQLAISVYSPPLDRHGSSVRGIAATRRIAAEKSLHFVQAARIGRSAIREHYPITDAPSGVRRNQEAADVLTEHGHRAQLVELHGDLLFAGAESATRHVSSLPETVEILLLDVRKVDEVNDVALGIMEELQRSFETDGRRLAVIDDAGRISDVLCAGSTPLFPGSTEAIEWAEERLIRTHGRSGLIPDSAELPDFAALSPLTAEQIADLDDRMEDRTFEDGELIRRSGQKFGGVYFILSGDVAASTVRDGHRVRYTTLGPGMTFGEIALGGGAPVRVRAQGPVVLRVLTADAIERIEREDATLALALWKAVATDAYTRVEQNLQEVAIRVRI